MPKRLPEMQALKDAMEIAGQSPQGAEYLAKGFEHVMQKSKMADKHQELLGQFKEFSDRVALKFSSDGRTWDGQAISGSDFNILQANLAEKAAEHLKGHVKDDITMDLAISDQADIVRGYSIGDVTIDDPDEQAWLDSLLNGWLAENDIVSKDGVLYEKGDDSAIKKDGKNEPVRADADKIKTLFSDSDKGFEKYMQDKGYTLSTQQHSFPAEESAKPQG